MDHSRSPDRLVGVWLVLICLLVVAMILVGGATRLTDSGLSITEWNFAKHFVPPLSAEGWSREFDLYKRTEEFRLQNHDMSLADFKTIYLWEWGHRFLGQVIGVVFALPFLAFAAHGRLKGRVLPILGLGVLGGAQGAVGWWMVTSGLFSGLNVDAVRLAIHLSLAFLILAFALSLALRELGLPRRVSAGGPGRAWHLGLAALIFLQIFFGALVSGTDAGLAYSDWPKLGGRWGVWDYHRYYPFLSNFTENMAAVQLHHRLTAYAAVGAVLLLGTLWLVRGRGPARLLAGVTMGLVLAQAALGVAAIMLHVPFVIALLHHAGAVALWISVITWGRAATVK